MSSGCRDGSHMSPHVPESLIHLAQLSADEVHLALQGFPHSAPPVFQSSLWHSTGSSMFIASLLGHLWICFWNFPSNFFLKSQHEAVIKGSKISCLTFCPEISVAFWFGGLLNYTAGQCVTQRQKQDCPGNEASR